MNKFLLSLTLLAALATSAWALVEAKGSLYASAATSTLERNYIRSAHNLYVRTTVADVEVVIKPITATSDTFVVRAGSPRQWEGMAHTGFQIIRTSSTAVDVEWW